MDILSVDQQRCIRDGLCLRACPRDLLIADRNGMPTLPKEKEQRCTRCGHCETVCPVAAIRIGVVEGECAIPLRREDAVTPAQADQLLRSCRSVRRFREESVPRAEIASVLQVARLAPSGGNNQMVRWIVLSDRQAVKTTADLVTQWFDTVARHNPRHASRYAIDNILARYRSGTDTILRGAPNAVLAYTDREAAWGPVDSAIALTYFNVAAHARGIGCCWGGYLIRAASEYEPLKEYLGIPANAVVQGAMAFGYADITYHAIPVRNAVRVVWL